MKSIIVIPTFNEAENVRAVVIGIHQYCPDAHLLFVDDGSPDGTADLVERVAAESHLPNCRVCRRKGERGLGRAYRDGFRLALEQGYDLIVQMDADLSHDPSYLPALLGAAERADLVIGSRYCPGGGVQDWPLRRRLLSRFAVTYVQMIARIRIADATAGFRCWTRRGLQAIDLASVQSEGYAFQVEMSYRAERAGLVVEELPIVFTDRKLGKSKISRGVLLESMVLPWRFRMMNWRPRASGAVGTPGSAFAVEVSR